MEESGKMLLDDDVVYCSLFRGSDVHNDGLVEVSESTDFGICTSATAVPRLLHMQRYWAAVGRSW